MYKNDLLFKKLDPLRKNSLISGRLNKMDMLLKKMTEGADNQSKENKSFLDDEEDHYQMAIRSFQGSIKITNQKRKKRILNSAGNIDQLGL